jgi:hypothetical protein
LEREFYSSFAVKSTANKVFVLFRIIHTDNSVSDVSLSDQQVEEDRWTRFVLGPLVAQAGKTIKNFVAYALTHNVNDAQIWMDGVMFTQGPPSVYLDGSMGTGHYWVRDAHGSISVREAIAQQLITVHQTPVTPIPGPNDPIPIPIEDIYFPVTTPLPQNVVPQPPVPFYGFFRNDTGLIRVHQQLFIADQNNRLGKEITSRVDRGSVEMDLDREVKMVFNVELRDPDIIWYYNNYLAPFITLEYSSGKRYRFQLGLFSTRPPSKTYTPLSVSGRMEAYDLTWRLLNQNVSEPHNLPAGKNYVEAVYDRIRNSNFSRIYIPPTTKVLAEPRSWKPGTPVLRIINDLLEGCGYYSLWASRYGILRSMPYLDLNAIEPIKTYVGGEDGAVLEPIATEPVLTTLANHVIVIKDTGESGLLKAVRKNLNPASPTSIQNLGLITRVVDATNAENQTDVDALANRLMQEWGSVEVNGTLRTLPEPWHNLHEVYQLQMKDARGATVPELTGRFWATGWRIGFTPEDSEMTHSLKRVVRFGLEV